MPTRTYQPQPPSPDQVKTSELELDEATVEEKQYEEYGEFDLLQEESENLEDIVAEMSALECTYNGCTAGEGGAKFRTPALAPAQAVEYLRFHREDAHGQRGAAAGGGAEKVQLSKIPRPEISGGCSQEDFKFFTRKWDQYVRSSNEKDDNKLKDQLTNIPDDTLRSALYKALGDRINTISVTDLLKEIEVLAVVNKVQQDREDQRLCTYCGQKGHGKFPNIDLRKADCPAHGKKCAKCHRKDIMQGFARQEGETKLMTLSTTPRRRLQEII